MMIWRLKVAVNHCLLASSSSGEVIDFGGVTIIFLLLENCVKRQNDKKFK